ncbi:MAG: hypothetical protein Q8S33_23695 [Myxococcales bacterium]|nr:hypothetical protein [Myxococcales bacterium]MDP3503359.1 hypothetical protein [Myxococcales bacterium]
MTAAAEIPTKPTSAKDAVALLKADHQAVNALFAEFEKVRSAELGER